MFYARTVSFYLRDFNTFFASMLPRPPSLQISRDDYIAVAQLLNRPHLSATHGLQCQASFTITLSLPTLISTESVIPSNHLILRRPLLLLPSVFPTIRVFSKESVLHIKGSKSWSFSFSISPFNEYSGLISLMIDWFDLAFQGIFKSLL